MGHAAGLLLARCVVSAGMSLAVAVMTAGHDPAAVASVLADADLTALQDAVLVLAGAERVWVNWACSLGGLDPAGTWAWYVRGLGLAAAVTT